jgi:predicted metalloprotease with PDZ domain
VHQHSCTWRPNVEGSATLVGKRLPQLAKAFLPQRNQDCEKQFQACNKAGVSFGGALVQQIAPGSTAASAGLQVGDIIVGVQKYRACDTGSVARPVANMAPCDSIWLRVLRANHKTEKMFVAIGAQSLRAPGLAAAGPAPVMDARPAQAAVAKPAKR